MNVRTNNYDLDRLYELEEILQRYLKTATHEKHYRIELFVRNYGCGKPNNDKSGFYPFYLIPSRDVRGTHLIHSEEYKKKYLAGGYKSLSSFKTRDCKTLKTRLKQSQWILDMGVSCISPYLSADEHWFLGGVYAFEKPVEFLNKEVA
jgi:hypothetical protein